jgi:uncharacterized 2Fe-2S/4Fe-4S cluster protein (DUF4445 family)
MTKLFFTTSFLKGEIHIIQIAGKSMSQVMVIFEPSGLRVLVECGTTILDAARNTGIHIASDCGGRGTCGKCKVIVEPACDPSSHDLEYLTKEELAKGFRLACKIQVHEKVRVLIPQSQDLVKILSTTNVKQWKIDKGLDNEIGVAIDLGTTTLVAYLLDLSNGVQLAQDESLNPQTAYGEDVISRITYSTREKKGAQILQQRILNSIDQLISNLLKKPSVENYLLTRIVIVGNTAMHHLLLGANTESLGKAPYQPSISGPVLTNSQELGLKAGNSADVYLPPNIAGFVGGDTVGFILSQRLDKVDAAVLGIDIGTNGEIVFSDHGQLYCCSAAAGPAFEGAKIVHGMRGQSGAIEYVSIIDKDERPDISIIGEELPRGLCGSAIVDMVAELHRVGIVDDSGRMKRVSSRVIEDPKFGLSYVIVSKEENNDTNHIIFTQKDVRQVQLAKAAIQAGTKLLLQAAGRSIEDINQVLLAGAFGNYIRPESALSIGLLPRVSISQVIPVGNAAGEGAKGLLLSKKNREIVERFVASINYVELASHEKFQEVFLDSISLLQ